MIVLSKYGVLILFLPQAAHGLDMLTNFKSISESHWRRGMCSLGQKPQREGGVVCGLEQVSVWFQWTPEVSTSVLNVNVSCFHPHDLLLLGHSPAFSPPIF